MSDFEKLVVAFNGGKRAGAQTRLAEALNVKPATVNRWCKKKAVPAPDVQADLARVLGVSEDALMRMFSAPGAGAIVAESAPQYGEVLQRILSRLDSLEQRMGAPERGPLRKPKPNGKTMGGSKR